MTSLRWPAAGSTGSILAGRSPTRSGKMRRRATLWRPSSRPRAHRAFEFFPESIRVCSAFGDRTQSRNLRVENCRGSNHVDLPAGRGDRHPAQMRMTRHLGDFIQPSVGKPGRLELLHGLFAGQFSEATRNNLIKRASIAQTFHIVRKARLSRDLRLLQKSRAETDPLPVVLHGEYDVFSVRAAVRAIGRKRRVLHARASGVIAAVVMLEDGNRHPVRGCIKQRNPNARSLPATLPVKQRLQDRTVRRHASGDIADRYPDPCGSVFRSRDGAEARLGLDNQVVRLQVRQCASVAKPRNVTCDEAWESTTKLCRTEAKLLDAAWLEVLYEYIRRSNHGIEQQTLILRRQVQADRFFAPVEPNKVSALPLHKLVVVAREITFGTFDLDHPRAGIGQPGRCVRCGHRLLDRDDRDAFERFHPVSTPMLEERSMFRDADRRGIHFLTSGHRVSR